MKYGLGEVADTLAVSASFTRKIGTEISYFGDVKSILSIDDGFGIGQGAPVKFASLVFCEKFNWVNIGHRV